MTLQKNSCIFSAQNNDKIQTTKCHKTRAQCHVPMYLAIYYKHITAVYNILEVCKRRVASYKHLHLGFLSGSYMYMMPYAVMREKPNKFYNYYSIRGNVYRTPYTSTVTSFFTAFED